MAKLLGGTVIYGTGTVQSILYVQSTATSSSTTTGALQVVGGAGIGGPVYVGGDLRLATNASYIYAVSTSGSSTRMMGINPSNVAYIGPIDGAAVATIWNAANTSLFNAFYTSGTEKVRIDAGGGLNVGYTTAQSGALLSVNGGGYFNGTVTATNFVGAFSGTISGTATTSSQVNTVLQTASGTYYPTFVNANNASATGMSVYTTGSHSINPATGGMTIGIAGNTALTVLGTSSFGAAGSSNGDMTVANAFNLVHGVSGGSAMLLTSGAVSGGTSLTMSNTGGSTGTNWKFAVGGWNQSGSGGIGINEGNLVISYFSTATMIIQKNTGFVSIGAALPTAALTVTGGASISGITTVTNTTSSISSTTGALQILGGAGIVGNLNVGGTTSTFANTVVVGTSTVVATTGSGYNTGTISSLFVMGTATGYGTPATTFQRNESGTQTSITSLLGPKFPGVQIIGDSSSGENFPGSLMILSPGAGWQSTRGPEIYLISSRASTAQISTGTFSSTQNGDQIGRIMFGGDQGTIATTSLRASGSFIAGTASSNWSSTSTEGSMTFGTTPFGSTGAVDRVTISSSGKVSVLAITTATSTTTGALTVVGGVGMGGSLFVGGTATIVSTLASTASVQSNALYVAGGVGIASSLYVTGPAVFQNNVTFSGTSTYVYSTNTVYTDNLIELHSPAPSTTTWAVDDGKDIGFRIHYYANGADQNAALVLANDTKYLEWYSTGTESTATFVNATYGTFKTGSIILTNTATSTSTTSGALVVAGSVGVGGNINFGGNLYQNGVLFTGGASLTPTPIKTSAYTAVVGDLVRVNSAGGTFTVNLPASPSDGNQVGVFDIYGNCGTTPILIGANTKSIEGDATGVNLNIAGAYVVFLYSSITGIWKAEVIPSVNATSIIPAPIVLNDISTQFDGVKTVFALKQDQTSINTIVDSKDLEVVINGQRLTPYVDTLSYPWLTPYDSFRGFRVSSSNLIIYTAPPIGGSASLIFRQSSTTRQKKKYPYSAATIAFGD